MGEHILILPSSEAKAWKRRQEFFWEQLASGNPPFLFDANPENYSDEKSWGNEDPPRKDGCD